MPTLVKPSDADQEGPRGALKRPRPTGGSGRQPQAPGGPRNRGTEDGPQPRQGSPGPRARAEGEGENQSEEFGCDNRGRRLREHKSCVRLTLVLGSPGGPDAFLRP
ncbi:unnamed protein product [Rangifer tarandus platyrhynchus]|uniref:Uncharacterized protein n=1 Tax=Rangifer tarandus platyrhynchus TaxID=3082113 RepID=A0AC59ZYX1_RANTA